MDLELTGKRVIVTGGSKGIGRAIAQTFLDEGASVAICARNAETLATTAHELSEFGDVVHRTADLGVPGDAAGFVGWAADTMGGVDIVVSNVSGLAGPDWEASCAVDLIGANELIRAGLDRIDDHSGGNIVCIGSRAGNMAAPTIAAYGAVKAATVSMVKSLSHEVARRGIRANVVSPGDVIYPGGFWQSAKDEDGKVWQHVYRANPLRRLGEPREIADVVAFIASARSSFVTGANILVDGGATVGLQI